jgi:catechol 2,3-dioxygenase-like lactoylglutathione lyase family enzyme
MPYAPPEDQLVLELFVRDFEVALAFYTALGFAVERTEEGFAVLRWEGCGLLLQVSHRLGERPARPAANLRILVPDVDERWRLVQQLGAPVFVPIADRDYGLRDFIVSDPDGFGIRFASQIAPRPA